MIPSLSTVAAAALIFTACTVTFSSSHSSRTGPSSGSADPATPTAAASSSTPVEDRAVSTPAATAEAAVADAPPCQVTAESSLPGVSLSFPEAVCVFTQAELADGVKIPYRLVVAEALGDVLSKPQDGGRCQTADGSGLIIMEKITGNDQSYCICDSGNCRGIPRSPLTLATGTYDYTLEWNGRNWYGPSDTSNPKGEPFPPGSYEVMVYSAGVVGSDPYQAEAVLTITIE